MQLLTFATLIPPLLASAIPLAHGKRQLDASQHCGRWDTVTAGEYELFLNKWGASGATSGTQCAQITNLKGNTITWKTTFNWVGGNGIKSFTNIQLNAGINKQLSVIKSMPASWRWSMSPTSIVADVTFDLFTYNSPGGANVNEVMIWLANFNAGPISSQYNSDGTPKAVASNLNIAGYLWNMYQGSNGFNNVYSFLPTSGSITNFDGDIYSFFAYLIENEGVSSSQYLITAQAGTEATTGSAALTTSDYSLAIN